LKSTIVWDITPCTRRYALEDGTLHNHRCENHKSCKSDIIAQEQCLPLLGTKRNQKSLLRVSCFEKLVIFLKFSLKIINLEITNQFAGNHKPEDQSVRSRKLLELNNLKYNIIIYPTKNAVSETVKHVTLKPINGSTM
jgi:hypothetical protein